MPFVSGVFQVGDETPSLLEQTESNVFVGMIRNTGKRIAYLGASDVSKDTGFPIAPGEVIEADMHAKAAVYAISELGGTELRWITVT